MFEEWIKKGSKVEITWDDSTQLFYAEILDTSLDCDFVECGSGISPSEALKDLIEEVKIWQSYQ